jgi:K+-sensing histidine kinase KdpD
VAGGLGRPRCTPTDPFRGRVILLAAIAGPIAAAVVLTPWRGHLDTADNALILVVVIVAVASTGRRLAVAVAALVSALAFDFFLTRPYGSFRITREQDLITELLLVVVGLAVGELAARGQTHRVAAADRTHELALLHSVTELAASGQDPRLVIEAALKALQQLRSLRNCHFTRHDPGTIAARLSAEGTVTLRNMSWKTEDLGLPTRRVDLPVRAGGWLLGHFLLTPTPGTPVSRQQLSVAVAIADQVGTSLVADLPTPATRA